MKLALIGRSMISPFGLAMRPRMPASWRICVNEAQSGATNGSTVRLTRY